MKHLLKFILFFVSLIGFGACQHQYPAGLVEADSLLWSNPKLAQKRLCLAMAHIDTTNKSDVIYMRLLEQLIRDRLYMKKEDANGILQIVSFYEDAQEKDKMSKSYYLLARTLADLQDDLHALFYYQKALKVLDQTDDVKLRALIYHQIGYIMKNRDDIEQAKLFFFKAYQCDSLSADTSSMAFALMDMAVLNMSANQGKQAFHRLRKALFYAKNANDEKLVCEVNLQLATYYVYNSDNTDSVWYYLCPSMQKVTKDNASTVCFIASEYYWAKGQLPQVEYYLLRALSLGDVYSKQEACRRLTRFYTCIDNVEASQLYMVKYLAYGDSVFDLKEKEHKQNGKVLYDYIVQKDKLGDLNQQVESSTFCGILLLLCLTVIFFAFLFYYQLGVVKKLKLRNKINDIRLVAFSKDGREKQAVDEIKKQLELESYALTHKHLSEEIWQKLDVCVNDAYPGFKDCLYSLCNLSEQEYRICLLTKIDVGTAQIAIFTARSMQSISMAKQRLYKKITTEEGQAVDLYVFLKAL